MMKPVFAVFIITVWTGFGVYAPAFAQEQGEPDPYAVENLGAVAVSPQTRSQRGSREGGTRLGLKPAALVLAGFDRNSDYSINRDEFVDGRARAFSRADSNRSGTLTPIELERWREMALGSAEARPGNLEFDGNFDRAISRTEFDQTLERAFNMADTNEDGIVAFSELTERITRRQGRRGQSAEGSEGEERGREGRRPPPSDRGNRR